MKLRERMGAQASAIEHKPQAFVISISGVKYIKSRNFFENVFDLGHLEYTLTMKSSAPVDQVAALSYHLTILLSYYLTTLLSYYLTILLPYYHTILLSSLSYYLTAPFPPCYLPC